MQSYKVNLIKKHSLTINGRGNNLAWNTASILKKFVSPWESKEPEKIEFKALWDSENLFFCFIVHDTTIHVDKSNNSIDSINNSDRVELFFRIDPLLNPYYCLEIDPTPRIMDFVAYPNKKFDFGWSWPKEDLIVKSHIAKEYFTVEIKISIASLQKLNLIKDNTIETGIFRAKYNRQENSNYEPTWITWVNPNTETPNFHTPSAFGILNLMEP